MGLKGRYKAITGGVVHVVRTAKIQSLILLSRPVPYVRPRNYMGRHTRECWEQVSALQRRLRVGHHLTDFARINLRVQRIQRSLDVTAYAAKGTRLN